jgi:[acyl-carrier-protein] S-malonyltransferase
MQAAVPEEQGAVAAILGPDNTQVIDLCSQAAQGQVVAEVNFNSPGQVVIAGDAAQRWRAMALASEIGAKRVMHLPVSVPAHCDLMIPAARRLAIRLAETRIRSADVRVVHSTDATSYEMLIPSNMRVSVSSTAPCAGWKPCEHSPRLGRQAFWSLLLEGY